jgi:hypothetical protein
MNSVEYQKYCFTRPIGTSIVFGGVFTGISMLQGFPLTLGMVAVNVGGIYAYNVLQCPMEAISRRQSSLHNFAAGAILGYVGVSTHKLSVPFVDYTFFYRYPQIPPAAMGAFIYGSIGFGLALFGGKTI